LTIAPPPITATCAVITGLVQGVPMTPLKMNATGGAGTLSFSAPALAAAGLTMAADGTISGTPTVNGTITYTVTVTDAQGHTGTANCSLTIAPPPITATCAVITGLVQGVPMTTVKMNATGGVGSLSFSAPALVAAGLTMAADGTISGTPTTSGTINYTVTVT